MANRITTGGRVAHVPPPVKPPGRPIIGTSATRRTVLPGWALLQPDGYPDLAVLCELDDPAPDPIQGYGGFEDVPRQHDKPISRWRGFDSLQIPLHLYIDGIEAGRPVADVLDNLEALAGRGPKRLPGQPPKLLVDTGGVMRFDATVFPDMRWVIQGIEWSDDEDVSARDSDGRRLRAACTVTLTEFVEASRLQDRALKSAMARQSRQHGGKRYTVKPGDTLVSIARRQLGDPGRWPEIAKLNNIRDPDAVKPGARLRLP